MFLVALLVGLCVPMAAQTDYDDTKSFKSESTNNNINGTQFLFPKGVISCVATTNGGSNTPRIAGNTSGNRYLRLRSSNMLAISANNGYVITKIEMTPYSTSYYLGANKEVVASYNDDNVVLDETPGFENNVFTIKVSAGASRVTLTNRTSMNNSSDFYISEIKVYYKAAGLSVSGNTSIKVGDTSQLTVTGASGSVSYSSNKTSVATVDGNGLVTAVSPGTATITVKSGTASKTIDITVSKGDPTIKVSGFTSIAVGETKDLTITTISDGALSLDQNSYVEVVSTDNVNKKISVRGKAVGSNKSLTIRTASTTKYNAASQTHNISVTKGTPTIVVDGPTSVIVGEKVTLTVTTSPDVEIQCSGNEYVKTTIQGKQITVEGLKYWSGPTLTISTKSTTNYNAATTTHSFSVSRKNATPTLTATSTSLAVGGSTQLTVSGSDGRVTYKSDNENVAVVDQNGKVTAKGDGVATITATIAASDTYNATTVTIKITVEGPEKLDGNGATVYYIRNVSTGLYIKYGGSYGMDAIEGRAAHPFKLYSKGNNVYALASIHGYFNSMYSNSSLFLDRPEGESNWKLELVENTTDVYYMRGENGYALASVGNQYGILEFRKHDTKDIYQKWQLVTEGKLREEMGGATVAAPVDITPFIKGAAFDYADHIQLGNQFFTAEETPFYGEITEEAGSLPWNNTPVEERIVENGLGVEDAEHSEWQLTHSYVNYWDGFKRMEHYGARWSDDPSVGSNTNLNGIGLSRNNIHNEYMVEQYIGELPAGTYVLSYQGFYATTYSGEVPTVSVATATGDADLADEFSEKLDNYTNSSIRSLLSSSADNRGLYVATMFRDNRENDSYRGSIQFKLTEPKHVGIRIHKNRTNPETGGSIGGRYQWMIAFDDFTLIYQGNENTEVDQAILYYDRVKAAYEYYSKKVSELGVPASYTGCHLDGCVHWTAWDNAINGVVTVNGLNLRGNEYTTPSQKFAYLNGTAASNKIDTEKEFLEALSKIEAAYQAAYAEHLSHATDITNEVLSDPSFENGGTGWQNIDRGDVFNKNEVAVTGLHLDRFFSIGSGYQSTDLARVAQETAVELEPGLYRLSALVATEPNVTAYLVANGYYSGISSPNFNTFVEHSVLFLVENKRKVTIAVVGHNNPYAVDYPLYGPHYFPFSGSSFRADNFRLQRVADLPQGRVQLALAEVDAIQIDDYAKEAAFADENSLQAYRINTYTDDAAAKTAVADIYARFRNTVKAQKTKNADMTYAISDPSFEHGIADAWEFSEFTDEGWGENDIYSEDRFIFTGSTGRKVFNTWQGGNASGPISQKITGIPNGRYRVTAVMASDQNVAVLTANGVKSPEEVLYTGDNNIGKLISVETQVTDHTLEISAEAKEGKWYKVDNFRLTFLGHKLDLDHATKNLPTYKDWYTDVNIKRPVASKKWHSFVVPFDMPVPENWDVRKLVNSTVDETGEHIFLDFSEVGEVTTMEAGVPYMVRYYPDGLPTGEQSSDTETDATIETIVVENVDVDTEEHNDSEVSILSDGTGTKAGNVSFEGTYNNITLPAGYFYVSNNQFYVSKGGTSMKGYRGYFTIEGVNVKSIGMRTGRETGIESSKTEDVTVVGIYDVNGVRRDELSEGLNIVRMSNGTTIKMMIK